MSPPTDLFKPKNVDRLRAAETAYHKANRAWCTASRLVEVAACIVRSPRAVRASRRVLQAISSWRGRCLTMPLWLREECRALQVLEPSIPAARHSAKVAVYRTPYCAYGQSYSETIARIGEDVSHLILTPHLVRGGADLEAMNYAKAIQLAGVKGEVAIVATDSPLSPWGHRVPEGCRFVNLATRVAHLLPDEQDDLLARLLHHSQVKTVHIINSQTGFRMLAKYGRTLAARMRFYASAFCDDFDRSGNNISCGVRHVPQCFEHLNMVLSDNATYLRKLSAMYAFDEERLAAHYQPVAISETTRPFRKGHTPNLQVLWA
jgi:hypothetical protein